MEMALCLLLIYAALVLISYTIAYAAHRPGDIEKWHRDRHIWAMVSLTPVVGILTVLIVLVFNSEGGRRK
jgi:uncharacterized BrkB/YihY/UPF0761 family membrane protein